MSKKIYLTVAAFVAIASLFVSMMFYMRITIRRQRQSVKEPEVEGQEEDKSTLLGAESKETEEKE